MKKMIVAAVLCWAPAVFGASCVSGTLQSYVNLGSAGCQDGSTTFSGFTSEPGQFGGSAVALSLITVTPGMTGSTPFLMFSGTFPTTGNIVQESFFRFSVSGISFTGSNLSLTGSFTGGGSVTATEDVCPGASFTGTSPIGCTKTPQSLVTLAESFASMPTDSKTFAAATPLDVFIDLVTDRTGGTASFTSATASFTPAAITATPEPATFGLIFTGCAALFLRRRSTNKTATSRRDHAAF